MSLHLVIDFHKLYIWSILLLFYEQPSQIQCSQALLHTRMILNDPLSLAKPLRNLVRFEACFLTIFLAVHVCCAQSPLHSTHDTLGYSLEEHIEVFENPLWISAHKLRNSKSAVALAR